MTRSAAARPSAVDPGIAPDAVLSDRGVPIPDRRLRSDYEASELGAMLGRMLRALVRRATAGELDAVVELQVLERAVGAALIAAARGAHGEPGRYSWTEIAVELGITRQAAWKRFELLGAPPKDSPANVAPGY